MPQEKAEKMLQAILQQCTVAKEEKPVRRIFNWRYAAAAAIILLFAAGIYFMAVNKPSMQNQTAQETPAKDIQAPASSKAVITLANGQKVLLDSINSGMLATQGNINVVKLDDGHIVYSGADNKISYNTLFNPRGSSVVSLTLQDGSKVWLNCESSITYPVAFSGNERNVEITGEAYFEVAKDPRKKFTVTGSSVKTEVLGTHFNMNTFKDENSTNITLLEGAVKVVTVNTNSLLAPGEQAQVGNSGKIKIDHHADLDKAVAWKNGVFNFENSNLEEVMRQLSHWYDIEVLYEKSIPNIVFGGKMGRNLSLAQVTDALKSAEVNFRIEAAGRKLVVLP
jgi:transmembrane sensor